MPAFALDTILQGDCLEVLAQLPKAIFDACITDPPYGLSREPDIAEVLAHWLAGDRYAHGGGGFMGQSWDSFVPGPEYWRAIARSMKPGAHLLAFGGTRTYDLLAIAIRLAGFEVRDQLDWFYGSGFPKSLAIALDYERRLCIHREGRWVYRHTGEPMRHQPPFRDPEAQAWAGWGTGLKPGHEPIILARKPLAEPTIAANVRRWETGALHIDACRIAGPAGEGVWGTSNKTVNPLRTFVASPGAADYRSEQHPDGRWPPNLLLSHTQLCGEDGCAEGCPIAELDRQSGVLSSGMGAVVHASGKGYQPNAYGADSRAPGTPQIAYGDEGGASRFYPQFRYAAKASRAERDAGCEANRHPTVKPLELMRWLCRLIAPPDALILDPFAGSGTTLLAAIAEGLHFLGIEREAEYVAIDQARIAHAYREQMQHHMAARSASRPRARKRA